MSSFSGFNMSSENLVLYVYLFRPVMLPIARDFRYFFKTFSDILWALLRADNLIDLLAAYKKETSDFFSRVLAINKHLFNCL